MCLCDMCITFRLMQRLLHFIYGKFVENLHHYHYLSSPLLESSHTRLKGIFTLTKEKKNRNPQISYKLQTIRKRKIRNGFCDRIHFPFGNTEKDLNKIEFHSSFFSRCCCCTNCMFDFQLLLAMPSKNHVSASMYFLIKK